MKVNLFVTCIGELLGVSMARSTVLLLEQLGCDVYFPKNQGGCGQPAINGGCLQEMLPGIRHLINVLAQNNMPIISPSDSMY